ncbi:MAG TPA: alpha/beta fold hydrolase [Planctomycetota bacterium]|nr:alpha/beta fold hydrolase [Planctomycetota bacterium]
MNSLAISSEARIDFPGVAGTFSRIEYTSAVDGFSDWAIVSPSRSKTWIVFVHGHGSSGDQLFTRHDIKTAWLPVIQQREYGILAVNLRGNAWMSRAAASDLHGLLSFARKKYEAQRFIFASGSMGGTSNLIYAVLYPQDVSAVLALCPATDLATYHRWLTDQRRPICAEIKLAIETGYGATPKKAQNLFARHSALKNAAALTMPVYVSHGTADEVIPVEQSRGLAAAMQGAPLFRYDELPDGGHDTPLQKFDEGLGWLTQRDA